MSFFTSDKSDFSQLLMKANTGINLYGFFDVIENIAKLRSESVASKFLNDHEDELNCDDIDVLKKKCFTAIYNLSALVEKISSMDLKNAELQLVPYEIIDFCHLVPVAVNMCAFYQKKKLLETSKLIEILNICSSNLQSYGMSLSKRFGLDD